MESGGRIRPPLLDLDAVYKTKLEINLLICRMSTLDLNVENCLNKGLSSFNQQLTGLPSSGEEVRHGQDDRNEAGRRIPVPATQDAEPAAADATKVKRAFHRQPVRPSMERS